MDVDKIPVIGKVNRTINILMINFVLLGIVSLVLGVLILFFPKVLEVLISALLVFAGIIFIHIAYNIHCYKHKYMKWID